ncbi:MAG TPA: MOSC N-terminal beta barrel domain-containing protein [Candidatus Binataceae bacterium]|nr:MOSC N-terminal beta barrel domain-containing protein [Candidatus Binataceae bacterium]
MAQRQIGIVKQLYRYPVKSMLGEQVDELVIAADGVVGDRAWALREANGRIATAKKSPKLFEFRAAYAAVPTANALPSVTITLPDGSVISAEHADASAAVSRVLGRSVKLERSRADEHSRGEIDPQTIFGDVGVERVMPQFTAATMPDSFGLRYGSFHDSAAVHLLATSTLAHLRRLIGADAQVDARRFRPNIVVDDGAEGDRFAEDEWLDGELGVGEGARVTNLQPALRCVMTTHQQGALPRDLRILRAAAQHHNARLGVFAAVGAPGRVRVGDPVWLIG